MRAGRLLSILLMLQTRGRVTAEELAKTFEVSVRTIYRDIDRLSAADLPVHAERGPGGGFRLLDGFHAGLADQLVSAQLKLAASLPERTLTRAQRISGRFHLDPVAWFRNPETEHLLPAIAKAVWNETALDVSYRRADGIVARRLEPLGLVLKAGAWYLVATAGDQLRTYRVSGIVELAATGERFTRPKDFDLERFWTGSARAYEAGLRRGSAVLRLSRRGLARLETLGDAVAEQARQSAGAPDKAGWVVTTVPIESIEHAAIDLLRLGSEAEVLRPAELRRQFAAAARAMARINS